MTNKISSAEQAKEALIKLKSKGALLSVDFTMLFTSFSFEGYITDFDGSTLMLAASSLGKENPPTLTLAAWEISNFDGDFREDESEMFLRLMVTRPIGNGSGDFFRFHLRGYWSRKGTKARHIN